MSYPCLSHVQYVSVLMQPLAIEVDTAFLSDLLDFYLDYSAAAGTNAEAAGPPVDSDDDKDAEALPDSKEIPPEVRYDARYQ